MMYQESVQIGALTAVTLLWRYKTLQDYKSERSPFIILNINIYNTFYEFVKIL